MIKDAILKPIAAFARTTSGYPLLCTVMGKDPITGEPVPQDPETLLGGFMKLIGEEEIWEKMQKAKAIPRAFAWFKGAIAALQGFVSEIPGLFVQAFKSLEVVDIILIPRAFVKLAGVFGDFVGAVRHLGRATRSGTLLEIIFDVVSPGALAYIKKTGAALKSILQEPAAVRRQPGQGGQARLPELRRQLPRPPEGRAHRLADRLAAGHLHPEGVLARRDRQVRVLGARPHLGQHPRRSSSRRPARPSSRRWRPASTSS